MTDDDPLALLEEHIGGLLSGLTPRERIKVARKAMMAMRRSNTARLRKQVQPDGSKFAERAADRDGKRRRGPMFRKLRLTRNWHSKSSADGFELGFKGGAIGRVAAEHHYGLRARMRLRDKVYDIDLPARELIGHNDADRDEMLDIILELLDEI